MNLLDMFDQGTLARLMGTYERGRDILGQSSSPLVQAMLGAADLAQGVPGAVRAGVKGMEGAVHGDYSDPTARTRDIIDGLGLVYGGSAFTSAPKGALRTFGGANAKTADKTALSQAQELAQRGVDRRAIWDQTGWFQGADGKWRFEIDDSDAFLESPARAPAGYQRLQHDELQAAYPEMWARTQQSISGKLPQNQGFGGFYDTETGAVVVGMPDDAGRRSSALHEFQHAVQGQEGFARGGNPAEYMQQADAQLARDAMAWRRELASKQREMPGVDRATVERALIEDYRKDDIMDWVPSREARDVAADMRGNPDAQLQELVQLYGLDQKTTPTSSRELYRRTAGEVESRNVQTRRDMTPEQRRATPPWETQDVPAAEQIVRFGGGDQAQSAHAMRNYIIQMLVEKKQIPPGFY